MLVAFPLSPNNQTLRTTETVLPEAAKDEEGEAGATDHLTRTEADNKAQHCHHSNAQIGGDEYAPLARHEVWHTLLCPFSFPANVQI